MVDQIQDTMVSHSQKLADLACEKSLSEIVANLPEIKRQLSLLEEKGKDFRSYLSKPFHQLTHAEQQDFQNAMAARLRQLGIVEDAAISDILQESKRRPRGRPVELRYLALQALILKHDNPRLTLPALARELNYPEERLRRDVVRLRALLRKHSTSKQID